MTEDMTQSVPFRAEIGRRATERGGVERVEQHVKREAKPLPASRLAEAGRGWVGRCPGHPLARLKPGRLPLAGSLLVSHSGPRS